MKKDEKKTNAPEEVKTEENVAELTDEQLSYVTAGEKYNTMFSGCDKLT